jgi:hypothetical protein
VSNWVPGLPYLSVFLSQSLTKPYLWISLNSFPLRALPDHQVVLESKLNNRTTITNLKYAFITAPTPPAAHIIYHFISLCT